MEQPVITASPRLRATFFIGAAVMLGIWGWSLVPAIESRNNPNEDGFSFIPAFYGTLTFLPLGLRALFYIFTFFAAFFFTGGGAAAAAAASSASRASRNARSRTVLARLAAAVFS